MRTSTRTFEDKPAVREKVPLLVGLMGPSGGGKTFSALRLATGIQSVSGGDIYVIDTESKRALHYASDFNFRHIAFGEPFGSLDYLAALQHCVNKGAGVIIVDSMSHEHEGPGGYLDTQECELDRLAGQDYKKRESMKFMAWQKPAKERKQLIQGLLHLNANFIFCFRAKEKIKMGRKQGGGMEITPMGFMPIAGEEMVFEMTMNCLLLPRANGVPTWRSDEIGERMMMKLPGQFAHIFANGDEQLDENVGRQLAEWATGDGTPSRDTLKAVCGALIKSRDAAGKAAAQTLITSLFGGKSFAELTLAEYAALQAELKKPAAIVAPRGDDNPFEGGPSAADIAEYEAAEERRLLAEANA